MADERFFNPFGAFMKPADEGGNGTADAKKRLRIDVLHIEKCLESAEELAVRNEERQKIASLNTSQREEFISKTLEFYLALLRENASGGEGQEAQSTQNHIDEELLIDKEAQILEQGKQFNEMIIQQGITQETIETDATLLEAHLAFSALSLQFLTVYITRKKQRINEQIQQHIKNLLTRLDPRSAAYAQKPTASLIDALTLGIAEVQSRTNRNITTKNNKNITINSSVLKNLAASGINQISTKEEAPNFNFNFDQKFTETVRSNNPSKQQAPAASPASPSKPDSHVQRLESEKQQPSPSNKDRKF